MRYLIRERFFHLGEDSDVTDDQGNVAFRVDGKLFSLRGTLIIRDPAGNEAARVERKLLAFRPTYEISRAGQEVAEIRKKFFTPFHDEFTIDIPGPDDLEMVGDFFAHEFVIRRGEQTVATISKKWLSLTDSYAVDISPGEDDGLILASVLALDLAEDQKRSNTVTWQT